MRYRFCLVFLLLALSIVPLRAADDDSESNKAPPEDIPDFNHLDEYIYQPKSILNYGFRFSAGIKASFSGNGIISAPESLPDAFAPNISRTYHDGNVQPDTRTMTVDNGDGVSVTVPINPDGKTNTWVYVSPAQLTPDGFMQFHLYSAQTLDNEFHSASRKGDLGWELTVSHDLGRLSKHLSWSLFGGMSVNDIQAATQTSINAAVTTVTDTYNLYGQTPPPAPYTAPSSATQTVVDQNDNPVASNTSLSQSVTVDTTTLLSNSPISRTVDTSVNDTTVINHFKLHGSYVTFRGGPQLVYSFNDHLHLNISAGPALIYAGSQFLVDEVLLPETGGDIVETLSNTSSKLLLGYYADATLQYDFTERSGVYLGAFFQSAGSYNQTADTSGASYGSAIGTGSYTTKVEFNDTEGIRTGVSFKF